MKYTVIMLYPDYSTDEFGETYLAHTEAESIEAAVVIAQNEAYEANNLHPTGSPVDFAPVGVFHGHLNDLCPYLK